MTWDNRRTDRVRVAMVVARGVGQEYPTGSGAGLLTQFQAAHSGSRVPIIRGRLQPLSALTG
jgi:hypothetical protein